MHGRRAEKAALLPVRRSAHNDAGAQASWAVRRTNGRPDHLLDSLLSSQAGDVGEPHQRLDPADGAPRSVIVSR
jgi:hypothetical protein